MGYFLNREFEFGDIPEEIIISDTEKQIDFHKNHFLDADLGLVAEVLKKMITGMAEEISEDSADSIMPILSGMAEAIIMLRAELEVLRMELLKKKSPPPDHFDECNDMN